MTPPAHPPPTTGPLAVKRHVQADDGHIVPLRPYGIGELLAGAGRVLARSPRPLLLAGSLVGVSVILVRVLCGPWITTTLAADASGSHESHAHLAGFVSLLAPVIAAIFVLGVGVVVSLSLVAATLPDERAAYVHAWRQLPALIAVEVIRVITLVVLGLFGIGVYLFVQWSMAPYALVVERQSILGALRRSAVLTRGSWWRVLGLGVMIFAVVAIPLVNVASDVGGLGSHSFSSVGSHPTLWETVAFGIASVPLVAFAVAFRSLLYVDLRCRREGLAWKLDAARRGPERELFGPAGVYALPPWPQDRRA